MVVLLLMQLQPFTVLIRWLYCIVTSFTSCLHDIQFSHIIIMTWEITCILQDITWICLLLSLEQRHRDMQNYGCLNSALTVEWACIRSINGKKATIHNILFANWSVCAHSCILNHYTQLYLREVGHWYKVDKYPGNVLSDHFQNTS